ncbi:hypothetical protein NSMM_800039 [Nitrosomonas mobilis]|uniref:Uncharacterized protein n=1 Tax=Nitrosomonas mobilis TaxID=51642 RepID=A0A1G5SI01_9PROT|nr:hypothetical protein NSMM_800039 [Nitrosomonas mobilis]
MCRLIASLPEPHLRNGVDDVIQSKHDLADLTVGTGEKWIGNLNNTLLKTIFLVWERFDLRV